jgi:glutaminyl-peptide cyclotransferase
MVGHNARFRRLHSAPNTRLCSHSCGSSCPASRCSCQRLQDRGRVSASTSSYTEGFFYRDGLFYEGTGLKGSSAVLVVEWTWQSHICFIYDRFSLRPVGQFTYSGEGWGMTRTSREIITSDGTATLRFRNPKTFQEIRYIVVKDDGKPVEELNELEYVKGEIYANIWHSDRIARISPKDGHVIGWIDLTGLLPASRRVNGESVLNGIAYDAQHDRLFVTGKQWPTVFEIQIVPAVKRR